MTPGGTSNELDVQNEWEENTHTLAFLQGLFFVFPTNITYLDFVSAFVCVLLGSIYFQKGWRQQSMGSAAMGDYL